MTATQKREAIDIWFPITKKTIKFRAAQVNNNSMYQRLGAKDVATGDKIKYAKSYTFPGRCQIYDKQLDKMRIIAYRKNEMSIYEDLQSEEIFRNPEKFPFEDFVISEHGILEVSSTDRQKLEFLSLTDWCGNKPGRRTSEPILFYHINEQKQYAEMLQADSIVDDAKAWVRKNTFNTLLYFAQAIGIDTREKESEELRYILTIRATHDPEKFLKSTQDHKVAKMMTMLEAKDKGIIIVSQNAITFENGNLIHQSPVEQEPINHFLSSKDIKTEHAVAYIKSLLNDRPVERVIVANADGTNERKEATTESKPSSIEYPSQIVDLVKQAFKLNIMEAHPSRRWIKYGSKEWKTPDGGRFSITHEVYAFLTNNPEELNKLQELVKQAE